MRSSFPVALLLIFAVRIDALGLQKPTSSAVPLMMPSCKIAPSLALRGGGHHRRIHRTHRRPSEEGPLASDATRVFCGHDLQSAAVVIIKVNARPVPRDSPCMIWSES